MNHIQLAACTTRVDQASYLMRSCLQIEDDGIAKAMLPDAETWKRMTVFQRIDAINKWLSAECFALVDDSEEEAA